MTRTQRATSPRAILKDRSESKSGYDKSLRKGGAGPHNWGSMREELELEQDALVDAQLEGTEEPLFENTAPNVNQAVRPSVDSPSSSIPSDDEELEQARKIRAGGFNGNIDLGTIARTSAGVSASPPKSPVVEVSRDAPTHSASD